MISVPTLLLVSIAGGFVGALGGMGGGVVLIPVLTFLGLPIKKAIAVSIVSVIATSSGSAAAYVRDRLTNLKIGMFLEMFTILGALAGAAATVRADPAALYFAFGFVLLASWVVLFLRRKEEAGPATPPDALSRWLELEGRYPDRGHGWIGYHAVRAGWGAPLMFGAGLVSGLLGIGAGALKVLIHDLVMGLPPKVSTTTSNLVIGVTALAGTSVFLSEGLIDPGLAAPVILGVLLGAFLGAKILVRLKDETVRRFFLAVLAVLGIEMLWRGWRAL